jgi:hypothetical protein
MTAAQSVAEMARRAQADSDGGGEDRAQGGEDRAQAGEPAPPEVSSAPEPPAAATSAFDATPPVPANAAESSSVGSMRRPALREWERLLAELHQDDSLLAAVLEHAIPRVVTKERIAIVYDDGGQGEFYRAQASTREATQTLVDLAQRMLGGRPEIEVRVEHGAKHAKTTVAAVTQHRRAAESESRRRDALSHPKVLEALEVFPEAAGSVEVKLRRPA